MLPLLVLLKQWNGLLICGNTIQQYHNRKQRNEKYKTHSAVFLCCNTSQFISFFVLDNIYPYGYNKTKQNTNTRMGIKCTCMQLHLRPSKKRRSYHDKQIILHRYCSFSRNYCVLPFCAGCLISGADTAGTAG